VHVVTAGGADAELAADALWQAGAVAVEERDTPGGVLLVAALDGGADPAPLVAAVAGRWPAEAVAVDLAAALDAWRPYARAVTVGRVTVRPPWVRPASLSAPSQGPGPGAVGGPGHVELVVDPGRAFGSGSHASTRLALRALEATIAGGERVLDVGCGSGVLALVALALGAREAVAVDVDPAARDATRANAERNGLAGRLAVYGGLEAVPPAAGAELVVANILAPVLVELADRVRARLAPGGALVLSGFLAGQRPAVLAAYPGLAPVAAYDEDGWVATVLR
jgi:ribosomal protein L11 methyltransferase